MVEFTNENTKITCENKSANNANGNIQFAYYGKSNHD